MTPDLPDWDQVRPAFTTMLERGYDRDMALSREGWVSQGLHEVYADYFDKRRWKLWCDTDETDTTFNAQQRDEYRSLARRSDESAELLAAGIDRDALQRGIERGIGHGMKSAGAVVAELLAGGVTTVIGFAPRYLG